MVMDMEAGLEHLSRGTDRNSDVMLVVVEPYYKSLETAGRVFEMAAELGIPRFYAVANKVRSQADASVIQKYCENHGLELIESLAYDEQVAEASQVPLSPLDYCPKALAVQKLDSLAGQLLTVTAG